MTALSTNERTVRCPKQVSRVRSAAALKSRNGLTLTKPILAVATKGVNLLQLRANRGLRVQKRSVGKCLELLSSVLRLKVYFAFTKTAALTKVLGKSYLAKLFGKLGKSRLANVSCGVW